MPVTYRLCAAVHGLKGQKIDTPADLANFHCLHYGLREFGTEWCFKRNRLGTASGNVQAEK